MRRKNWDFQGRQYRGIGIRSAYDAEVAATCGWDAVGSAEMLASETHFTLPGGADNGAVVDNAANISRLGHAVV